MDRRTSTFRKPNDRGFRYYKSALTSDDRSKGLPQQRNDYYQRRDNYYHGTSTHLHPQNQRRPYSYNNRQRNDNRRNHVPPPPHFRTMPDFRP